MTRRTPSDVDVAKRLLEHERPSGGSASERAAAAVRVYEKLFERLSPVIGVAGMRAVLARSATLTKVEFPCFEAGIGGDEPAKLLHACLVTLDEAAATAGATALYATLLGLLNSFIGERLVWQVLRSAFPGIDESKPKETES
jgi:hypothetical protein